MLKNEKENRTWFKQIYFQCVTVDTVRKYIVVHLRGWKTQSRLLRKIQKFLICPSLCYSSFNKNMENHMQEKNYSTEG
jgi:hypothetical protein